MKLTYITQSECTLGIGKTKEKKNEKEKNDNNKKTCDIVELSSSGHISRIYVISLKQNSAGKQLRFHGLVFFPAGPALAYITVSCFN
jgi:hypothetical protein